MYTSRVCHSTMDLLESNISEVSGLLKRVPDEDSFAVIRVRLQLLEGCLCEMKAANEDDIEFDSKMRSLSTVLRKVGDVLQSGSAENNASVEEPLYTSILSLISSVTPTSSSTPITKRALIALMNREEIKSVVSLRNSSTVARPHLRSSWIEEIMKSTLSPNEILQDLMKFKGQGNISSTERLKRIARYVSADVSADVRSDNDISEEILTAMATIFSGSADDAQKLVESMRHSVTSAPNVWIRGFLHKRGGRNSGWKMRWCELDMHNFKYYVTRDPNSYKGNFSVLDVHSVDLDKVSGAQYRFQVTTPQRVWKLYADSEKDRQRWVEAIRNRANL